MSVMRFESPMDVGGLMHNGITYNYLEWNPFGYEPWRINRTFESMFDILEADIVVLQETKIQRKDLRDDMVLVPGWDVYFSLPKHKKGYSGVAIYTRNATCSPIRAEEGITGILTLPNSSTSFCDLPADQQIGGYPTVAQLSSYSLDAAALDSEGRCVILEFPAMVLIGVYSPANRDETRDEFRLGFLNALDARVRNLTAAGKRVFLTGDLNIIREELDTANADEQLRKHGMTGEEYVSTPARRLFNQLVVNGKVIGPRDEGREQPVLWDICRSFHPARKGMFTCWEQKKNARPGNFGSRIDYVLCSQECKTWFCESNIQEGLMGSDHCPVYAVLKDTVDIGNSTTFVKDIMNPPGVFKDGIRVREWDAKEMLPLSAKLIPEFDRRRNIRDMFTKKTTLPTECRSPMIDMSEWQSGSANDAETFESNPSTGLFPAFNSKTNEPLPQPTISSPKHSTKRPSAGYPSTVTSRTLKRSKSSFSKSSTKNNKGQPSTGQSSLIGFFKPKLPNIVSGVNTVGKETGSSMSHKDAAGDAVSNTISSSNTPQDVATSANLKSPSTVGGFKVDTSFSDPIVVKESWSKLLSKRVAPRCEHDEPCISLLTKKSGLNCGRSFYICPRPLGPSGTKEKGTEWRCGTFIWSSDWTGESIQKNSDL